MKIAITAALGLAFLAVPAAASAHTGASTAHRATCNADWYQNPDETALKPKQLRDGMLFDGPSLAHHKTDVTLATAPPLVGLAAQVQAGVAPPLKLETSPYSTINKTTGGWWSSKIAATGEGGQNHPVASLHDLVGLWQYTADTQIVSFGIGYANDTGNRALVTAVIFGRRYSLACAPVWQPPAHHRPAPRSKPTHIDPPAGTPGEAPVPTPVNSDLPVTG